MGVHESIADVFRAEYARVVASVLRIVRDIDAAEDVVQEAFAQALEHWPARGIPDLGPGGVENGRLMVSPSPGPSVRL